MGKPLARSGLIKKVNEETVSNGSGNPLFSDVLHCRSRRRLLQGGGAIGMMTALNACTTGPLMRSPENPQVLSKEARKAAPLGKADSLGFRSVPFSNQDTVVVPEGYTARAFYKWGDPVGIDGYMPRFLSNAGNSAPEQAAQAGMHHDGMAFFPLPQGSTSSDRGLLAMNHEYVDNGLLFPDGTKNWTREKVEKSQNAMGISVVEVARDKSGAWQVVRPSRHARRITPHTPMEVSGPARGHALMKTQQDPAGEIILGTMQNCANGFTPWGTYLTCEENWADIFILKRPPTALEKRYGVGEMEDVYLWGELDARFDATRTPNEPNRFGWVVEIDPYNPESTPVKHTSLGRFKHEGATMTVAPDGRVVVYSGDDQRFEYIYKFVSNGKYDPDDREANMRLLSEGTLYAARFDDNGKGEWLPLVQGSKGLTKDKGFADQGEVLVKTRMAADVLGATPMDRPEWIAVDPFRAGSVYCTLTNNDKRGTEGQPGADAANPREKNLFGHVIHWQEDGDDATSTTFTWDILVLAGRRDTEDKRFKGSMLGDAFGSPDGLSFDHRGVLWIQTDVSSSTLNKKEYAGMGNNQMVATIPGTNEFRRFLTAPNGAEVTGIAFTPDNRTLFINIQHPGEPKDSITDPDRATAISSWPDGPQGGRPRAATVVITKDDGGVIGS